MENGDKRDNRQNNNSDNRNNRNGRNNRRNRNERNDRGRRNYGGNEQRGRFKRRRRRDFFRRNRSERKDWPRCPICEREVMDLSSAITYRETGTPAHFDCVMRKIGQNEDVSQNEKICYLGKGSFGIIRMQKAGGSVPFIIRKRIQYETMDTVPLWRKELDKVARREHKPKGTPPEKQTASGDE